MSVLSRGSRRDADPEDQPKQKQEEGVEKEGARRRDWPPARAIPVGPKVVTVRPHMVLWSERMGHPVTNGLVEKALRQYLKTLERTRRNKRNKRRTEEGRETIKRQNRESASRRRADVRTWRGDG